MDILPAVPLGLDLIGQRCVTSVNTAAGPSREISALLFLSSS